MAWVGLRRPPDAASYDARTLDERLRRIPDLADTFVMDTDDPEQRVWHGPLEIRELLSSLRRDDGGVSERR